MTNPSPLEPIADLIRNGGVAAFPTETVYGLGASVWDEAAVREVFRLKGRPDDNPLIVHVANFPQLRQLALDITAPSRLLIQKFWPGPLTLVFRKRAGIPDVVTAGLNTVAVRMPRHALALELIRRAGPLVGPSANRSGWPSPTTAAHVRQDFGTNIPILDGGASDIGLESTVLDVTEVPYRILRPGMVTASLIKESTGLYVESAVNEEDLIRSPGNKHAHYAPNARVTWLDGEPDPATHVIRHGQDLVALAARLYAEFRAADEIGATSVAIERIDEAHPLAHVLLNRIVKAMGV
jgi:L-threonylcarbamoyladenylate synthase